MFRTIARVVLALGGLLLLLLVAVMLLLQTPLATPMVESRLRAWVHPELQVNGSVQVSVLPSLGLSVKDVAIPSQAGVHPALSIKELQWQAAWGPLFERRLAVEMFYLQGVQAFRSGATWGPFMSEVSQTAHFDTGLVFDWIRGGPRRDGEWEMLIKQALIEDVAVFGTDGDIDELPLATLKQLKVKADVNWPAMSGSQASLSIRRLSVNNADQFGHTPALLEQLGIATDGAWDVMAMDSAWQVDERNLNLQSFAANGAWGELLASGGVIDMDSGQISIPMKAILTNAPTFRTRALAINVRQSQLQFELTGTVNEPGVQWLTQPKPNR